MDHSAALPALLAQLYRDESRRVLPTLIYLLGDFDLVDDAPRLNRRLGRVQPARDSYQRALQLAQQGADRQFLQMRLDELPTG